MGYGYVSSISSTARFARQMAQVLSVDKLSLGFFLGAGCPVSIKVPVLTDGSGEPVPSPLIPDVAGLTKLVLAELSANKELAADTKRLLEVITEDGKVDPNIEVILGCVRTLSAAAGYGEVRGISAASLHSIDAEICKSISNKVNKSLPGQDTAYNRLARFIAPRRGRPVEIFTTNYDLLAEQALEEASVPFFDGFVGSRQPFFDLVAIEQDVLPTRWARLWKLHGSINWRQDQKTRHVCRTMDADAGNELLIHPSHRKYDDSRRMPYLALIDRLRSFLRNEGQPVALFIHGFSFSDEHLNAVLEEGLRSNPQAACFAFQYGSLGDYGEGSRLAGRCQNLTIFARDQQLARGASTPWRIMQSATNSHLAEIFDWDDAALTDGGATDATFLLGDFAKFGQFLSTLTGESLAATEAAL
jgi:hypothetical protein